MSTLCKGVMVTWILRLSLFTPDRKLLLTWTKNYTFLMFTLCFTFWSLSSSKLSRSSKLTIWSSWNMGEPVSKMFPRYYMCVNNSLNHLWEDVVCSPDMPDVRVAILLTHAQYPNLHLELRIKVVLEWTKMSGIGWTRVTIQGWMNI